METIINLLQNIFMFEKAPQKIGLSQFKESPEQKEKPEPSIKNKNIKLSDLMRKESLKN